MDGAKSIAASRLPATAEYDGNATGSRPAQRRRWYQFSLRTLLIVMVAVSAVVGLVGIRMQRARRQHAATMTILKIGGEVTYGYNQPIGALPTDLARPWLGDDFFDSVIDVKVDLRPADTTKGQLAVWSAIGDCPQLAKLQVDYPQRYPRSRFNIGPIRQLARLRSLKIRSAQIDGDDLLPLARMPVLDDLDLSHNQIGDAAWRHLASVPKLHTLDASYTFLTDEGAFHLAQCRTLRHLVLVRASVTDRGAAELAKLSGLQSLVLDGTRITDRGLKPLSRLNNLQSLSICETTVSDAGLDHLAALPSLSSLDVSRTNVTDKGIRWFKERRPDVDLEP